MNIDLAVQTMVTVHLSATSHEAGSEILADLRLTWLPMSGSCELLILFIKKSNTPKSSIEYIHKINDDRDLQLYIKYLQ